MVNALSDLLEVEVARAQVLYRQTFSRGLPASGLETIGRVHNRRGTKVRFHPDAQIFGAGAKFDPARLFRMARSKAYLFGGVEIRWKCDPVLLEGRDIAPEAVFKFPGGLKDYLARDIEGKDLVVDSIFSGKIQKQGGHGSLEWAIAWLATGEDGFSSSYCNTIPTGEGGTHEQGLRVALLRGLRDDEIRIDLHPEVARDATRACFALADHPGIFSRLAGALALVGANVVDARTYTSKDGYATAVFWIQDVEGKPYEVAKLPRLRGMIDKTLNGEIKARDALKDRDKVRKRESQFRFPTHIVFDNEGSEIYTIIEVDTRDRPGLLFDLTRTLAVNNIYIASAVIATYGAQVVDTFYVKDMFGLKLHTKSRQEALERKLRQAIAEGAERALS